MQPASEPAFVRSSLPVWYRAIRTPAQTCMAADTVIMLLSPNSLMALSRAPGCLQDLERYLGAVKQQSPVTKANTKPSKLRVGIRPQAGKRKPLVRTHGWVPVRLLSQAAIATSQIKTQGTVWDCPATKRSRT